MPDEAQQRNELRDWVKDNAPLVTVTGVMLAAALFSRNLGSGKSVVWLVSCFVFLALLLIHEMFETFPPPKNDSGKLRAFKWVLGSAAANLSFYWMVIVYKAFGTWWLGIVSVLLGLTFGEWLVKQIPFFQDAGKPRRKKWGNALIGACGLLASYTANIGIPRLAPAIERDFLGTRDTTAVVVRDITAQRDSVTVAETKQHRR